ncbi:MAG: MoaD/ThiS family protein [Pseudomonadota bacterium]
MTGEPKIILHAYGAVGDVVATGEHSIDGAATVQALLDRLCVANAALQPLIDQPRFRVAVDQVIVEPGHALAGGEEVALLSPVSGG